MTLKQACEGWSIFWFGIVLVKCELRLKRRCLTPLFHNWIMLSSWPPNIQKDFTCLVGMWVKTKVFLKWLPLYVKSVSILLYWIHFRESRITDVPRLQWRPLWGGWGEPAPTLVPSQVGPLPGYIYPWEMLSFDLEHPH